MPLELIARGTLDYADRVCLIHDERLGLKVLDGLLYPHIGKIIVISLEHPEEEQSLDEQLVAEFNPVLQPA